MFTVLPGLKNISLGRVAIFSLVLASAMAKSILQ